VEEKSQPDTVEIVKLGIVAVIEFLVCYAMIASFLKLFSPFQEGGLQEFLFCAGIAFTIAVWIVKRFGSHRQRAERNRHRPSCGADPK
jgi:hypothetical protein